ncbi:aldehyde dehydrogenase, partial [Tsukamurella pulmonis]
HGPDGLREFTYAKGIARKRFTPLLNLTSFARTAAQEGQLTQLMTLLHGRGGTIK